MEGNAMINLRYFGTNLTEHGHYLWLLEGDRMYARSLDLKSLPFNPEDLPEYEKGEIPRKGDAKYYQKSDYSIIAIYGSCVDARPGTRSIFFIKGKFTKEQMITIIQTTIIANAIISQMPFLIRWVEMP